MAGAPQLTRLFRPKTKHPGLARLSHCNRRAVVLRRGLWKMSMFHSNTELLIDYWRARKGERLSPQRHAIDPGDFAQLLPQTFILGRAAPGRHVMRLIGGLVVDLHGRDLRGADFLSLWAGPDRPRLSAALEASRRGAEPVVVTAEARNQDGQTARLEILLAPLRSDTDPVDRHLGLYQPLSPLAALKDRPATELSVIRIASDEMAGFPALRLAAVDGLRIA